ncbi:MAG: NfeD family protein [Anaerovoracaceae bacterium]
MFGLDYFVTCAIVWLALAVLFGIIEAFTMGLVTIWFTVGAVAAAITTFFNGSILIQVIVFVVVSVLALVITRPLAKKHLHNKTINTNVDDIIGKTGVVTKAIKPYSQGEVKIYGLTWTAVTRNNEQEIKEKEIVKVLEVQGVKVIVEKV